MKTALFAVLTISLFAAAPVVCAQEFTASLADRDAALVEAPPPDTGVLQAAAREGRLLHVINPRATEEMGSGAEYVTYEEEDPFIQSRGKPRATGIRLLAFRW